MTSLFEYSVYLFVLWVSGYTGTRWLRSWARAVLVLGELDALLETRKTFGETHKTIVVTEV